MALLAKFYEQVLELRSKQVFSSEQEKQYEAQIEALIWCEIGQVWRHLGNKIKVRESLKNGEDILTEAHIIDGPAWAQIRYQQGHTLWFFEGNNTEALTMAQEALKLFENSQIESQRSASISSLTQAQRMLKGDPVGLGKAYTLLSGVETFLGKSTDALNHLNQALAVFEKYNIMHEVANVCCNLGDLYLKRSEYALAKPLLLRSCELAEEIGLAPIMSVALGNLGVLAARLGKLLEAESWYRKALNVTEQVSDPFYISLLQSYVATALIEQGKLKEAEPLLLRSLKIGRSRHIAFCIGFALVALGHLRLSRAFVNRTKASFAHLLKRSQKTFQRALTFEGLEADTVLDGKLFLAKIAFLLDELDKAQSLAAKVLEEAHNGELVWLEAQAQSLLGQVLGAMGQKSASQAHFRQALATFSNTGMQLEYARTLQAYNTAIFEYSKDPLTREQVLAHLKEAHQTFQSCNAILDLQIIEQLLNSFQTQLTSANTSIRRQERQAR